MGASIIPAGLHRFAHDGLQPTPPALFDVAVITPTIGRPELAAAARSVFAQRHAGRIQWLVGVDLADGFDADAWHALQHPPPQVEVWVLNMGFSTSVRHGGVHQARDGGALRTALSYLAHAPRLAYLDDDNCWHPEHLGRLQAALAGHAWAFSLRWFVHPEDASVKLDDFESVGPGRGVFAKDYGGFVDPNCLMIDKRLAEDVLSFWTWPMPEDPLAMSADRNVFKALHDRHGAPGAANAATVYYRMNTVDPNHGNRLMLGGSWVAPESVRLPPWPAPAEARASGLAASPALSIVTTCKARLEHLKLSLPTWIGHDDVEIIVVDYGCPQDTAKWLAANHPGVRVLELDDDPGFHLARARNAGAQAARGEWLLFLDADVRLRPAWHDWWQGNARPGSFFHPLNGDPETAGSVLCTCDAWRALQGYDEAFVGWGGEDEDFYVRLRQRGWIGRPIPPELLDVIRHGDQERMQFHGAQDRVVQRNAGLWYLNAKLDLLALLGEMPSLQQRRELYARAREAALAAFSGTADPAQVEWRLPAAERTGMTRLASYLLQRELVYRWTPRNR